MTKWINDEGPSYIREVESCVGFATASKIIAEIQAEDDDRKHECSFALAALSDALKIKLQNLYSAMHETVARLPSALGRPKH
jgi:hypothetical protein